MVSYCNTPLANDTKLYNASCRYNNTIVMTKEFSDTVSGIAITTVLISIIITVYAFYVFKKSLGLPNKQFFVLMLSLIIIGTFFGTYAVILLHLLYKNLGASTVLSQGQISCIGALVTQP